MHCSLLDSAITAFHMLSDSVTTHQCPGYDEEARYFEAHVRADKRKDLVDKAYAAVAGVRDGQLAALRVKVLVQFQTDLRAAMDGGQQGFTAAAAGWVPLQLTCRCMMLTGAVAAKSTRRCWNQA